MRTFSLIMILLGGAAEACLGDSLPAAITSATCISATNARVDDPVACAFGDSTASVALNDSVAVQAQIINASGPEAFSNLIYDFELSGGGTVTGGIPVDVISLLQTLTTSTNGFAEAQIRIEDSATGATLGFSCVDTTNDCANTTGEMTMQVEPGQVLEVIMGAFVHTAEFQSPASVYALADPLIVIDPSFANADQYTIQLSDGVSNDLPGTPEPGTLGLMAGAMLTAVCCRRARLKLFRKLLSKDIFRRASSLI